MDYDTSHWSTAGVLQSPVLYSMSYVQNLRATAKQKIKWKSLYGLQVPGMDYDTPYESLGTGVLQSPVL